MLLRRRRVALPDIFESLGQGLPFRRTIGVTGVAGEDKLVVITFLREHARSRRSGPERDSLLPLAEETARLAGAPPSPPIPHQPPL